MKLCTIEECFYQIRNGANIKQGVFDGGFPITRIETVSNDKFNRDRLGYAGILDIKNYESYVLETGDLLMSHINSVQYLGRTVLYERKENEKIIHGMNLLCLKVNKNILNPAYAKYYFYSSMFKKQISQINPDGTKSIMERGWFTRGNMLMVTGYRREDTFVGKTYKSANTHQLYKIVDVKDDDIMLQHERFTANNTVEEDEYETY